MVLSLYQYSIVITLLLPLYFDARSVYRVNTPQIPSISVYNTSGRLCSTVEDSHLELYPQFVFTVDILKKYLLPPVISYADNSSRLLTRERLDNIIEGFIQELRLGRKKFDQFIVLKSKNFNFQHQCGVLILKCKHHPFIVKLFIEKPETYFCPYYKGVESIAFFFMGGGANRHIAGMSRILNLDIIKKKLHTLKQWKHLIKFPRKWLWLPAKNQYMLLVGKNIGNKETVYNKIPEIFAIITDEVPSGDTLAMPKDQKKEIIINLCNDFDNFIDAHHDNFIFKEGNPHSKQPFTIIIIDTEHFPTMVGFKQKKIFKNYWQWYSHLFKGYLKKTLFRTKKERILSQSTSNALALI